MFTFQFLTVGIRNPPQNGFLRQLSLFLITSILKLVSYTILINLNLFIEADTNYFYVAVFLVNGIYIFKWHLVF